MIPAVKSANAVVDALVPWACLSLAGAFFGWLAGSAPTELAAAPVAVTRYLIALTPAAVVAGAACAILFWLRAGTWLARASLASALCYLGFLKIAGVGLAPWAALGLAIAAGLGARPKIAGTPMLLMVHAMGTLTGMYLVFRLDRYLDGWAPFLDVLRSLWWLAR